MSDFDGTLSDIHPNPNLTAIKPESKYALDELVTRPNVMIAIISGRPVKNLKTKIEIDNITYSGNHGMEMLFPNQTEWKYPITPEMYLNCSKIKKILNAEVRIVGSMIICDNSDWMTYLITVQPRNSWWMG